MFYTLIKHRFFDQSERAQGSVYIINRFFETCVYSLGYFLIHCIINIFKA